MGFTRLPLGAYMGRDAPRLLELSGFQLSEADIAQVMSLTLLCPSRLSSDTMYMYAFTQDQCAQAQAVGSPPKTAMVAGDAEC